MIGFTGRAKDLAWVRFGITLLGLLQVGLCVAGIYERGPRFPMAIQKIVPLIGVAGAVTAVAVACQVVWPKFKIPVLVVYGVFIIGLNLYCLRLPYEATPGQVGAATMGMVIIAGAFANPWFGGARERRRHLARFVED